MRIRESFNGFKYLIKAKKVRFSRPKNSFARKQNQNPLDLQSRDRVDTQKLKNDSNLSPIN